MIVVFENATIENNFRVYDYCLPKMGNHLNNKELLRKLHLTFKLINKLIKTISKDNRWDITTFEYRVIHFQRVIIT